MRCIVAVCSKEKVKGDSIKFYAFPSVNNINRESNNQFEIIRKKRCDAWIRALIVTDGSEISDAVYQYVKNARVCSRHFDHEPSQDIYSLDYIPHLNLGYTPKRYYLDHLRDLPPHLLNQSSSQSSAELRTLHVPNENESQSMLSQLGLETNLMSDMLVNMENENVTPNISSETDHADVQDEVALNILSETDHPDFQDEVATNILYEIGHLGVQDEIDSEMHDKIHDEDVINCTLQSKIIQQISESIAKFKELKNDNCQYILNLLSGSSANVTDLLQDLLTCFNYCTQSLANTLTGDKHESTIERINNLTEELETNRLQIEILQNRIKELEETAMNLAKKHQDHLDIFLNDDKRTRFYTGLPSYGVFESLFKAIEKYLPHSPHNKLTKLQMFQLTLMKLRLGLKFTDLAYRFSISIASASNYFHKYLYVLYNKLKSTIIWPSREELIKTMPPIFISTLGHRKIVTIIDCFEIFTEHPSRSLANAQCWSNYKHHETLKVLIGITPQGTIGFISKCYGGRSSDIYVTEDSKLLDLLLPGDIVMADRGFNLKTSVELHQAKLVTPNFVKGVSQLHPTDIETTRRIASLRIHVERAIGSLRQKYEILSNILPMSMVSKNYGDESVVDQIVVVCSGLFNLCPPIISQNVTDTDV